MKENWVLKIMTSFSRAVLACETSLHERVAALDRDAWSGWRGSTRPGCIDGGGHWTDGGGHWIDGRTLDT